MTKRKPEVCLRELHIIVEEREDKQAIGPPENKDASPEAVEDLERKVTETITNYLTELYGLEQAKGRGKLNVKFDFE